MFKNKIEFRDLLALAIVLGSFLFGFMLFFVTIPPENKTALDMITGAVIIALPATVISYYFGDSKRQIAQPITGTPEKPLVIDATITEEPAPGQTALGKN
jgi:hypothetical protein